MIVQIRRSDSVEALQPDANTVNLAPKICQSAILTATTPAKRSDMKISGILSELKAQKDRLDTAIAALSGSEDRRRPRRRLSAAAKEAHFSRHEEDMGQTEERR